MVAAHQTISYRSMLIAGFPTGVEWYDVTLYNYVATILCRGMFGGGEGWRAAVSAAMGAA